MGVIGNINGLSNQRAIWAFQGQADRLGKTGRPAAMPEEENLSGH